MEGFWSPYFDPEYEHFNQRINAPRSNNDSCNDCTLVKVDSVNRPGILLEVVQVLTDLDLIISKAYISSDGGWFMDVFHVTDQQGKKLTSRKTIEDIEKVSSLRIEQALGPKSNIVYSDGKSSLGKRVGLHSVGDHMITIELVGTDRPGLFSEISAVLADFHCNVVAAEVWTHNRRVACVVCVNDDDGGRAVQDPNRISAMEEQLKNVLRGRDDEDEQRARTSFTTGLFIHPDRRLHQMMFADRDYEISGVLLQGEPVITVEHCEDKGYLVVSVRCKDRPKLLFDTVCTLTDMQYVVFHASMTADGPDALQEYYIRHKDGFSPDKEGEKERVIKCMEAAIRRRVSEGLSLELCARDRVGLLSDVTRVLRENGLSVTRAGVTTVGNQAVNVFYVRDASGSPVDTKTIESLRKEIGQTMMLNIKKVPTNDQRPPTSNRIGIRSNMHAILWLCSEMATVQPAHVVLGKKHMLLPLPMHERLIIELLYSTMGKVARLMPSPWLRKETDLPYKHQLDSQSDLLPRAHLTPLLLLLLLGLFQGHILLHSCRWPIPKAASHSPPVVTALKPTPKVASYLALGITSP
ncbi:Arsenical-resistance protein 3 [Asimina triloba]